MKNKKIMATEAEENVVKTGYATAPLYAEDCDVKGVVITTTEENHFVINEIYEVKELVIYNFLLMIMVLSAVLFTNFA